VSDGGDLRRWIEPTSQVSAGVRAIVRRAAAYDVPPARMTRLEARLGVLLDPPPALATGDAPPGPGGPGGAAWKLAAWKLATGAAAVALLAAGVHRLRHEPARRSVEAPAVDRADPGPPATPTLPTKPEAGSIAVPAPPAPQPTRRSMQPSAALRSTRGSVVTPASREARPAPPAVDPLAEEVRLIGAAQQAVRTEARQALELTGEHRRRFPDGVLAQEREVLAIEALVRLGRSRSARQRAADFIRLHPSSSYRVRIGAALQAGDSRRSGVSDSRM